MAAASLICIFCSIFQISASASAQEGDRARALDLFEQSGEKYREGNFAVAAGLLDEAYRIFPEPVMLYNLARAYEGMGETVQARDAYQRYLESDAEIEDRGAIEGRIGSLTRQIEEREALEREREELRRRSDGDGNGDDGDGDDAEPEAESAPQEPSRASPAPWIVLGSGLAIAGVGIALGVVGDSRHDDAVGEPEHEHAFQLQDEAERLTTAGNALWISGAIISVGGLVWGIIDLTRDDDASVRVRIGPTSASIAGRF